MINVGDGTSERMYFSGGAATGLRRGYNAHSNAARPTNLGAISRSRSLGLAEGLRGVPDGPPPSDGVAAGTGSGPAAQCDVDQFGESERPIVSEVRQRLKRRVRIEVRRGIAAE
jgi:hypothetical protein